MSVVVLSQVWLDAHIPRSVAQWLRERGGIPAYHVAELGLRASRDDVLFDAARTASAVLVSKDDDLVRLVQQR